jgi:hypothetical protein
VRLYIYYDRSQRHAHARATMSVICKGCGKSFTLRGYNGHHSRRDAKPECQGRDKSQVATVAVNARNYRVSVQPAVSIHARSGGPDPDLDLDSEDPAPGRRRDGPGAAPSADSDAESGPGESCNGCKYHV